MSRERSRSRRNLGCRRWRRRRRRGLGSYSLYHTLFIYSCKQICFCFGIGLYVTLRFRNVATSPNFCNAASTRLLSEIERGTGSMVTWTDAGFLAICLRVLAILGTCWSTVMVSGKVVGNGRSPFVGLGIRAALLYIRSTFSTQLHRYKGKHLVYYTWVH